jgi:Cu(I)/Ag(I) efflux system membrane fusion protein
MNLRPIAYLLGALALAGGGAGGGYWYASMRAEMAEYDRQAAAPTPPGKKVLYWHDPMYPQQKFDKPGKSPFMDMQLVPVYGDDDGGKPGVRVDAAAAQSLGVRTAAARQVTLEQGLDAVGTIAYDEAAIETVQSRASGWIETLHQRVPDVAVAAGAPLASVDAPEWRAAQEEYLALARGSLPELAQAARARLGLLGITEERIAALERDGRVEARVLLRAPRAGVLLPLEGADMPGAAAARFAKQGMQVAPGMTLFRIAGLERVWVVAEVPEARAGALRGGAAVEVRAAAVPGRSYRGRIERLLPEVEPASRSVRARIAVGNPGALLRPGMYATLRIAGGERRAALVVPSEAIIATGVREIVMVAIEGGKYAQRAVETGAQARVDGVEVTEVRRGLAPGERVVVSGQFLIDSEASLKGVGVVEPPKAPAPAPASAPGGEAGR